MKFIKENLTEVFVIVGLGFISIGFFLVSPVLGFIGTGVMFLGLAYLTKNGGG